MEGSSLHKTVEVFTNKNHIYVRLSISFYSESYVTTYYYDRSATFAMV
jgi:hypothetical protein